jgi:eukaryotic-like serine/threonine-protein kinase
MKTVRPAVQTHSADARLTSALEEYRALLEAGERPDRDAFLAAHSDAGPELADCLAGLEFICAVAPKVPSTAGSLAATVLDRLEEHATLGDFRIIREIGRGGMGIVYEAEQISLGRRIALKVLPYAAMMDPRNLQRFQNEARAAASLHHEHIVPVHAVGCERGVHYYAMQYIEGFSLADLLDYLRSGDGSPLGTTPAADSPARAPQADTEPFPPLQGSGDDSSASRGDRPTLADHPLVATLREQRSQSRAHAYYRAVAEWGIQAAEALEHAHQMGIVHRDIKPGNLLVSAGVVNNDQRPAQLTKLWVTDFGLARIGADSGLTMTGDLVGTLRFMSPEQALGKHGLVDHRGDIYSLGATLYEVLTLMPAVDGSDRQQILRRIAEDEPIDPQRLVKDLPRDLAIIVLKAMAKEPRERFATAKDIQEELARFLEDKPIRTRKATVRERVVRWVRRKPAFAGVCLLLPLVLLLSASSGGALLLWKDSDRAHATAEHLRAEAEHSKDQADENRQEADKQRKRAERSFYAAQMHEAQLAWEAGDLLGIRRILDEQRPKSHTAD